MDADSVDRDDDLFWGTDSEGRLCSFRYDEVARIELRATMENGDVELLDPDDPAVIEMLRQQVD